MREKLGESESQKPREGTMPGVRGQGNCEWKSCPPRLAAGSSEVPCAEAGARLGCGTVEGGNEKASRRWLWAPGLQTPQRLWVWAVFQPASTGNMF